MFFIEELQLIIKKIKKMEINDILLDALGGLFGAPIHKKTECSKELTFDKNANLSLSA